MFDVTFGYPVRYGVAMPDGTTRYEQGLYDPFTPEQPAGDPTGTFQLSHDGTVADNVVEFRRRNDT